MRRLIGALLLVAAVAGQAFAGTNTPEIDPASGVAALGLLSGGLLVLRARKKK
ncbi:MAG: LPXTG cell wall anchor domain-containing protein [Acidobacteriota bacterium]